MLITNEVFQAFLKCETKSYLKFSGAVDTQCELRDCQNRMVDEYKKKYFITCSANCGENLYRIGTSFPQDFDDQTTRFVFDCVVHADEMVSYIHAIERLPSSGKTTANPYVPIRCVPAEKVTTHERLLLAFDALVLSTHVGKPPLFGKIIHGSRYTVSKVTFSASLLETAQAMLGKIAVWQTSSETPELVLNQHCSECEFQPRCREIAVEKDDLSLLSRMTAKERKKQHNRGIFTITQFSYTFRLRKQRKREVTKPYKYYTSLIALAIRERKIYILGKPEIPINRNPVYLDVEGIPDRDFYYLIGMRIKSGHSYVQHTFWAHDLSDEKKMWSNFIGALTSIDNPQLIYYGNYEKVFLQRLKKRYSEVIEEPSFLDRLIEESVNVLSVIYAQIYFPTYSNGLKDIAHYLGFQWSDRTASGARSLVWRYQWEMTKDSTLKQQLITYNREDCEALERVVNTVIQLCQNREDTTTSVDDNVAHAESLMPGDTYRFGQKEFSMPELEYINKAAYWDYQRDQVYVKSSKRLKRIAQQKIDIRTKAFPVDKIIACPRPAYCPHCKSTKLYKRPRNSRIVHDLNFRRYGIERRIIKYVSHNYVCRTCDTKFYVQPSPWAERKYGQNFIAYVIYQMIELYMLPSSVTQSLNQLFQFALSHCTVYYVKLIAAQSYKVTYESILNKIVSGRLIHADETTIRLRGKSGYVWVLTSLEEVVYMFTETREGDMIQELLRDFKGVLVSDYYAVYDAINCPQQKCLIHLMRDLNDDLLKYPFNKELKEIVREFAMLLKPIIETIDQFGLKTKFLKRHKPSVDRFYEWIFNCDYKTDIAVHYQERFDKNRNKLFTFLSYDDVTWNNNNAEHAIKAFAKLRRIIESEIGEKGIHEHLILLSICETCRYKGVSFLDFLRSGEKDVDKFIRRSRS
jgi:predicted RecB family nuclease